MEYSKLVWEVKDWWRCAGDSARNVFLNELSNTSAPSPSPAYETKTKKVDYSFCTDFSNDAWRLGDKIVYIYAKPNGMPFYVGMGNAYRPVNIYSRSDDFMKEFTKTDKVKVFIVAVHLNDLSAKDIETLCIWFMLDKNWVLCNHAKTTIDPTLLIELKEEFNEVTLKLNELNSYFLEHVLEDDFSGNTFLTQTGQDERYRSENIWEIDGETKTATEWCREYETSMSNALQRIVKFGLTPKEALTFPKMIFKPSTESALSWWKDRGHSPGSDTTSRVVSINYCGYKSIDDIV